MVTRLQRWPWFKAVRGIVSGLSIGMVGTWALVRGGPAIDLLILVWFAAFAVSSLAMVSRTQTPALVEGFMTERCTCGHTRREHRASIIEQPSCRECECDWLLVPIVLGPWDTRWHMLSREHQDRVLLNDAATMTALVLLLLAAL